MAFFFPSIFIHIIVVFVHVVIIVVVVVIAATAVVVIVVSVIVVYVVIVMLLISKSSPPTLLLMLLLQLTGDANSVILFNDLDARCANHFLARQVAVKGRTRCLKQLESR